jgi:hypothetical protein
MQKFRFSGNKPLAVLQMHISCGCVLVSVLHMLNFVFPTNWQKSCCRTSAKYKLPPQQSKPYMNKRFRTSIISMPLI